MKKGYSFVAKNVLISLNSGYSRENFHVAFQREKAVNIMQMEVSRG